MDEEPNQNEPTIENNSDRVTQIEDFLEKLYYFLPPIAELNEFKLLKEVDTISKLGDKFIKGAVGGHGRIPLFVGINWQRQNESLFGKAKYGQ